jgi:molybdenum cofactor cytidylyltransferase
VIVIDAVVLAAGQSARLGRAKQLLPYAGGSLLAHAVTAVNRAEPRRLVVVVGARSAQIRRALPALPRSLDVVDNPEWPAGIGTSIRTGLVALDAHRSDGDVAPADGVLLALCDQPLIPAEHFARLCATFAHAPQRIVASFYQGTAGVPAVFPWALVPDLCGLPAASGARRIIARHEPQIVRVPCPEAAFDVDTDADVQRLLSRSGQTCALERGQDHPARR